MRRFPRIPWLAASVMGVVLAVGCGHSSRRPTGPPPEYEQPPIAPWDAGAGATVDPFEDAAQSGWIEDNEEDEDTTPAPDAGKPPGDAGAEGLHDAAGVE